VNTTYKKLTVIIHFLFKKRNFPNQNSFIEEGASSPVQIFSKIKFKKTFYDVRGETECLIDSFIHSFMV